VAVAVEHPTSTVFFSPDGRTKEGEEDEVTRAFNRLYFAPAGPPDVLFEPGTPDPPDRLVRRGDFTLGLELTRVDQYTQHFARENLLANRIYAEFSVTSFPYSLDGICIGVVRCQSDLLAAAGKVIQRAASEVVGLVKSHLSSIDDLPHDVLRILRVNESTHPNLHSFAPSVSISRCPPNDIRRSDGKASPLVIVSGGYIVDAAYEHAEVEEYKRVLKSKAKGRLRTEPPTSWHAVDHSVLLFHDHPRDKMYHGHFFGDLTERAAREAVRQLPEEAATFDEIAFLTYRSLFDVELLQISGSPPAL
jgi:hypothetical protein